MIIKFKISIFLFVLIFPIISWGQNNRQHQIITPSGTIYKEGWIINNNGDTIKGYIFYGLQPVTPEYVLFRKLDNVKEEIKYKPIDILEFKVKDDLFVTKKLSIDVSPTNYDDIKENPKQKTITKTIFLKIQEKGKITLFIHSDANNRVHFFVKKDTDTTIYELTNRASIKKTSTGIIGLAYDNRYKGLLAFLMSDVSKIQPVINETKFVSESIDDVVSEYNAAINTDEKTYKVIHERFKLITGIQVGLSNTTYSSSKFNFSKSNTPIFGFNFKYQLPKHKRLFIDNDVQFTYYDTKSVDKFEVVSLKFGYIRFSPSVRYKLFKGKVSPIVELGLFFSIRTHLKENVIFYDNNNKIISSGDEVYGSDFSFYSRGVYAGVGVTYNKIGFDARYLRNNHIVKNLDGSNSPSLKTGSIEFILTYSFNSK